MPFACVGVTMHIEGLILEIGCHVCQYKYGRHYLEAGRGRRQVDQLKNRIRSLELLKKLMEENMDGAEG